MIIRQIKLDILYEYICHNTPISIRECIQFYVENSNGKHISRAYKQLYVLRNKGLIDINNKIASIKKKEI